MYVKVNRPPVRINATVRKEQRHDVQPTHFATRSTQPSDAQGSTGHSYWIDPTSGTKVEAGPSGGPSLGLTVMTHKSLDRNDQHGKGTTELTGSSEILRYGRKEPGDRSWIVACIQVTVHRNL